MTRKHMFMNYHFVSFSVYASICPKEITELSSIWKLHFEITSTCTNFTLLYKLCFLMAFCEIMFLENIGWICPVEVCHGLAPYIVIAHSSNYKKYIALCSFICLAKIDVSTIFWSYISILTSCICTNLECLQINT